MATVTRTTTAAKTVGLAGQRNYNEIVEFLDANWQSAFNDQHLMTMKALNKALGQPAQKVKAVLVQGTNGKSITINFCVKLLQEEGIKSGAFYSPHIMSYNERFVINNEVIANKVFVELANEVINAAHTYDIKASTFELLLMMALVHFARNNIEVVFLESFQNGPLDPTMICDPAVLVVTRITSDDMDPKLPETIDKIKQIIECVRPGTYVVSGDQSKLNLQTMAEATHQRQGIWEMPIRKLAVLQYPYEQLHGRCAALAERICHILIDSMTNQDSLLLSKSLLAKQKGQRGRPTLEAKRLSEINPKRTVEQFWKEESTSLASRFQLIKDKPTVLLDNASNIDAVENLLLDIRLLHYQRSLKGLAIILGCDKSLMNVEELLRLLRYFTKKNSAHIIFCPIQLESPGFFEESWNVEQVVNNVTSLKIKAKAAASFAEAFELAKAIVDERNGLVVVAGSQSIVAQYWKHKGLKTVVSPR